MMAAWGWVGVAYAIVLLLGTVTRPVARRWLAVSALSAYAFASLATASLTDILWVQLAAPGALLLAGYWLSGLFFHDPQPALERWLLGVDAIVSAPQWMARLPRAVREALELCYASVYAVVAGGAIYAATFGLAALAYYWTLVLAAELASFAPMPWVRTRPPRALEPKPDNAPYLRRLNISILDNASIQANTLPSGHVSGSVGAALGVMSVDAEVGWALLVLAGVIAVAAIAGRYHYVVDCVAGAAVAAAFWSLM